MKLQKLSCLTRFSHHLFHAVSLAALLLLGATTANAQVLSAPTNTTGRILPLDLLQITTAFLAAPMEFSGAAKSQPLLYSLPMPEGGEQQFRVVESPMMSADFQADFPLIKTYGVVSVSDPAVQGRLTVTPNGFFATILAPNGMVDIHPLNLNNPLLHKVTYEADLEGFECGTLGQLSGAAPGNEKSAISNGTTRRTYDLAIVTTGEFYNANGGTAALANAVVTATVSGIQAIYDRELAVRFTLLAPFHYTNPATDPFNPGLDRTLEAAQAVEANFPGGNYDIGHVFHETNSGNLGGGGVAFLNAVCNNNPVGTGFQKAGGWSGSFSNSGNGWIRLSGHEFGHMFGMDHTFNGNGDNCDGGNLSLNTAYEIASGTTIMSYNGICGAGQNIPGVGVSDNYFHTNSLTSAVNHIAGQTCHAEAATNNTPPVVNANPCGGTYTIPKSTPFRLTGSGADANGDVIYYAWEQYDEDGAGVSPTHGFIGAQAAGSNLAPLFRSYPPTTSPTRTFPNMNLVAANSYASDFEPLPSVARTLNFRLFGRDWNTNGGGIHCSPLAVTVSNDGPFSVSAPNGGETLTAGTNTTVTWSVANTNNAPVNCASVNIRLSVDGGLTFPYTLAAATPNDGSQSVAIPAGVANSTTARMMVECASNACVVFFDISNGNFTLTSACLAGASNICPASALSLPAGNAGLNLGLNRYFGSVISSHVVNVTGADPMVPRAMATMENGSTCTTVGTRAFKSFDIAVSTAGTYSFSITSNGFTAVSVFTSAGFNSASPCSSTFFGSNAWDTGGGGASNSGSFNTTMSLSACTLYKVMVYASTAAYGNITVGISGPGEVFLDGTAPAGSYSYTYVAVNTANGQVAAVSATSNFTALAAGSYNVLGASYYSGAGPNPATVNPATWVGQTPAAILAGGSCVLFSSNFKPVTVTGGGGCTPPVVNAPTVTQPTCPTPTGTIVVNATGGGTLEYSVNGGTNWQASNTFSGLAAGNYTLVVRLQANPTCLTNYGANPVVLNAATGCCTAPVVNAPTVTQPTCPTPTGTIVVNATGGGTLEYSVNGGTNWQVSATFSGLAAGNYTLVVRLQANPTCLTNYANNPVVLTAASGCCTAPVVNAPTVTQPTCPTPTGTIVVNATGGGTLEYSVNGGTNWQTSATFSGLAAGNYNLVVRLQANPTCLTNYGANPVVLNAATGCCTAPVVNAPTVTQPTCPTPTGTIVVNATGGGTLEYSVNGGTNWQASNTFSGLAAGNYNLVVRLQANPTCLTNYGANPVVLNAATGCCTAPVVNAPTVTQPTCPTPTGTITVNATGGGTLEYSVNGGTNWQASNTFSGLAAGNYTLVVRLQANPTCLTNYANNPVVLTAASGCGCTVFASTDVPKAISDGMPPITVTSTLNIPASGTITDVNVLNLDVDHTYINDLRIKLKSPANTEQILLDQICGNQDNILINLDDESPNTYASIPCPPNAVTHQPNQTLSPFDGQNLNGVWTLTIEDLANQDGGSLQAWSLEVCYTNSCTPPVINSVTVTPANCNSSFGGILVNATGVSALEYTIDDGAYWSTSANFENFDAGSYTVKVRLQNNPTCMTTYANNPVVIGIPACCPPTSQSTSTPTQPTCAVPTGSFTTSASGGSGPWEFSINNGSSYQASGTFSGLAPGTYLRKIRSIANPSCIFDQSNVVINAVPTPPVVTAPTLTQPPCGNPFTGTIVVNATGSGTLEYSDNNGTSWQVSNTFFEFPGSYIIKVRLQANPTCMTAYSGNPVVIAQPACCPPTFQSTQVPSPTCTTSGFTTSASGGSGPWEFSINNGATYQASGVFSGLAPGTYVRKIRSIANPSCIFDQSSVVISPPPTPPAITAPTLTQPTCALLTGTITVNATGGGTLEYSVNNGTSWQASNTFGGLVPGNYFISVRLQFPNDCVTAYASNPVVLNVPSGCCPLPTYSNSCSSGDFIQDFTYGTFSNLNTGCANPGANNLSNYLGTGPNVNAGGTYQVTVKAGPDYAQYVGLYIDLNGNGSYLDAGEFFNIGQAPANSTVSASVQIPASTPLGTTTMRVRSSFDAPLTAADGCSTNLSWGEVEDYSIYILCESPPVIFSVLDTQPINCADPSSGNIDVIGFGLGGTVQFSIDNGASWQLDHYFPGLPGGNYNVKLSYVSDPTCMTTYYLNPVVLDAAGGPLYFAPCTSGDFIQDFSFGTFSNLGTGCSNPSYNNLTSYLGTGPIVQVGETYAVTLRAGGYEQHFAVYIDFDQNGSYTDAGEFFPIGQAPVNETVTANLTIPVGTFTGTRKMRVRSSYGPAPSAADGCNTTLGYGEMEDYNIYIYCPNNLAVNGNPIFGFPPSAADLELTSTGTVVNGSDILFTAGNGVQLLPGFEVQLGGLFTVTMVGCFP